MVGSNILRFKKQVYNEIKKFHNEQRTMFSDPSFPAVDGIIGSSGNIPTGVIWKRPGEICTNPKLFLDIERSRIVRAGELSCNWFVSACAILVDVSELRNRVIPDYWEQEWGPSYCGVFHFRLWRFGRWHDVVVDDLLPTVEGVLISTQGESENEFWTALLEKAYAKLHGSYEGLREGELCDALVDFTGGISEVIDLKSEGYAEEETKRSQLLELLTNEMKDHTIICVTLRAEVPDDIGVRNDLGLSRGHAYHMTDVKKVFLGETGVRNLFRGKEKVAMVRLRDPRQDPVLPPGSPHSGGSGEYVYSTELLTRLKSRNLEWQKVKDTERHRLGLHFRDKTEFWMPLEDVVAEFDELTLCRLVTENVFSTKKKWSVESHLGSWEARRAAGGDTSVDTFFNNPQYLIDIKKSGELMVQLIQYHDAEDLDSPTDHSNHFLIGFHILRVEENRVTRLHKLWSHCPIVVCVDHRRKREVVYRGQLIPGRYLVLPSTFKPGERAHYLLRVFSRQKVNLREAVLDTPSKGVFCSCILPDLELVTVITVNSAEALVIPQEWTSTRLSFYCVIFCEGNKVKTGLAKEAEEPTWDTSFIFFRKKPDKPLLIQVFQRNALFRDNLLGECEIPAVVTHSLIPHSASLQPKTQKTESDLPSVGTLHLTILTEDNILAV